MSKVTPEEINQLEKLSGTENFQLWKFGVLILLRASDLEEVVKIAPPLQPDGSWNKKDASAQKILALSLGKRPLMHVLNCDTAHAMSSKLCSIYKRDSDQQKCMLQREFFSCSMNKGDDVASYVSKLENIACRVKALGEEITNSQIISKVLATLPESFRSFATAWESTPKEERTLENLTARLLTEEVRNTEVGESERESAVAFKTVTKKCFTCNNFGHTAKTCKKQAKDSSKEKRCFVCNKPGHFARTCPKAEGKNVLCRICKKTNHSEKDCFFRDKKQNSGSEKVSFLVRENDNKKWIVDSGTT